MVHIYRNYIDPLALPSVNVGSPSCRVVFRIPKGQAVIPSSIKVVNLSFSNGSSPSGIENKFNASYGVYEPLSYLLLRTSGDQISECRNPQDLARIMNCTGMTNDYIDGVYSLESGASTAMSIDTQTQLQTFRRALTNRQYVTQGYYKMEFNRLLPVLDAMPEIMDCGFELTIEMANSFKYADGVSLASIVLQYDELRDYKHTAKAEKINFMEWLPEKVTLPAQLSNDTMVAPQTRLLTYYGRTVDKLLMYLVDAAEEDPILLSGNPDIGLANPDAINLYINGQQFYPLLGLVNGYKQMQTAELLGGMVFPYNHLINTAATNGENYASDEPSVGDVLIGGINTDTDTANGDNVLNVVAFKLGGYTVKDLVLQISAYANAEALPANQTYPALSVYMWGQCIKTGAFDANGNFVCEYV
jgi:hypothetical protein